jgi:hypothetical protein
VEQIIGRWAEARFEPQHHDGAKAYRMWRLTGDEKWRDALMTATGRGDRNKETTSDG